MEIINLPKGARGAKIDNVERLHPIMVKVLDSQMLNDQGKACFWVIGLDHESRLSTIELVAIGNRRHVDPDWGSILTIALKKGLARLILAQNRVEKDTKLTSGDLDITAYFYHVGQYLQIPLKEHLIFTREKRLLVLEDEDNLEKILSFSRYQVVIEKDQLMSDFRRDYFSEGEKAGIIAERARVIQKMESEGLDKALIERYTGFSVNPVRQ